MTNVEPLLHAKAHIANSEHNELHKNIPQAIEQAQHAIDSLEQWKSELQKEQP